ncbi:MAG TPA: bifunctional 5,10-methylenetetrahydrofolate dehydrogenase/5,10-methenyltetrahydrofolate cyclohydrolase [Terriglobales bacterium]|nr:bifunctional 5,10-methylenetetrahydrofolate dehydrogenase/5,10-methenyltetrahydrofolate cyclohydrolase [Terriglobales bacterium]
MAEIMYGQPVAEEIERKVQGEVDSLRKSHSVVPRLDVILVGTSPASQRYVKRKLDACQRLGMKAELHTFNDDVTARELKDQVCSLGSDRSVHGILVQLPLPRHIEEPGDNNALDKFDVFDAIAAEKDVDGVSRYCIAELYRAQQNRLRFLPATAVAIRRMLAYYHIETEGRKAVVVGRNDITAKPVHHMLGGRMCNATAIWCHRYTRKEDHDAFMREADIIVTSVGSERYRLTGNIVKPGAVVIDVGTRVSPDGRLHGDVDFESVAPVASHITPVPRGVGPVTVAALTENVARAAQFAAGVRKPGYVF